MPLPLSKSATSSTTKVKRTYSATATLIIRYIMYILGFLIALVSLITIGYTIGYALSPYYAKFSDEDKLLYDAIVVGAGWAGVRAALTLSEEGISSILVLEASDYIGGRSKSVNSDGSINKGTLLGNSSNIPIDMGSEWQFIDAHDNEMADYLEDNGYLQGIDLDNSKDDVFGNYYKQSTSTNGTITTEMMEDSSPLYDVWNGWLHFRKEKLEEVDDISWFGE